MKRWLSHLMIVAYLGALFWGVVAHTLYYKSGAHPGMYFIVWDMFCGWAAHASRTQIIGEGESGKYYQLAPGPWGEFKPYGDIGRRHYDVGGLFSGSLAQNVLRHTKHEPIARIFVVEECWPKKYNLPDRIWRLRHPNEPKEFEPYYQVRYVLSGDGEVLQSNPHWIAYQYALCVSNNPRLRADMHRGKPFFYVSVQQRAAGLASAGHSSDPFGRTPSGARLGGSAN